MRLSLWCVPLIFCMGCGPGYGKGEDTRDVPIPKSSQDECGDTDPLLVDLRIEDGGLKQYEQDVYPSIMIWADLTDEDSDLHYYTLQVWYDDVVDGFVNTSSTPQEVRGTLSSTECSVASTSVAMQLAVTGNPPYQTEVEFGVIAYDNLDNPTNNGNPTIETFVTPDHEGNY